MNEWASLRVWSTITHHPVWEKQRPLFECISWFCFILGPTNSQSVHATESHRHDAMPSVMTPAWFVHNEFFIEELASISALNLFVQCSYRDAWEYPPHISLRLEFLVLCARTLRPSKYRAVSYVKPTFVVWHLLRLKPSFRQPEVELRRNLCTKECEIMAFSKYVWLSVWLYRYAESLHYPWKYLFIPHVCLEDR